MIKRKLQTVQRLATIRQRSLNEKCQELIQNESKLGNLLRSSELLRQRMVQVFSEQLETDANLQKQVQSALWGTKLENRFRQLQQSIRDCRMKSDQLRESVANQHNEIKALEKYIGKLEHELLCEAESAAATFADDLHLAQRQEGLWK